jgi:hypothetical protein
MIKAKFGQRLRSKTLTAQINDWAFLVGSFAARQGISDVGEPRKR